MRTKLFSTWIKLRMSYLFRITSLPTNGIKNGKNFTRSSSYYNNFSSERNNYNLSSIEIKEWMAGIVWVTAAGGPLTYIIYAKKKKNFLIKEHFNKSYPDKKSIAKIIFSDELKFKYSGELTIDDYPNLLLIDKTGKENTENIIQLTISNCPKLREINIINFVDNEILEIVNCPNLEIVKCENNNLSEIKGLNECLKLKTFDCNTNKLTNLDLSKLEKLEYLSCEKNQLEELSLNENKQLTEVWCQQNQLVQLTFPKLENLQTLICWGNNLTNLDFLNNCNPEKLESLSLNDNNFPKQDLYVFTKFKELKMLYIGGISKPSYFYGSLKPLQKLEKLEILGINGTDITHGLEYLPKSVRNINHTPQRPDAKVIDIYEELQPFGGDINKWREVKIEKNPYLTLSPLVPPQLINEFKREGKFITRSKLVEKGSNEEANYSKLYFNLWNKSNQFLNPKESPTKIYNIKEDRIEETNGIMKEPYAILSYVWGKSHNKDTKRGGIMITSSANKSINKATKALEVINKDLSTPINYLWVDQLCINQEDQHEKNLEVPKMGKYYDNSSLTLINMNAEIGDLSNIELTNILRLIINSKWFFRSWTFQEGWLSKWTVFMFDDILVDGRAMAGTWALNQLSYVEGGKYSSRSEFDRGTKKIATPVGWVYYRNGYDENDKVELTLTQALYAIKNRKRTEPLDGIYSILGLLPYGQKVKVNYSENNTPEKALREIMQVAIENGYAEPLAWYGASNPSQGLCWMPKIDENGSTEIVGSVGKVRSINKAFAGTSDKDTDLMSLTEQGLDFALHMPHYIICKDQPETIHKLESGFEVEGGLYRKEIVVKRMVKKQRKVEEETIDLFYFPPIKKEEPEPIKISLLGTYESLKKTAEGNILVVLHKEHYGTNKLLALLVRETTQKNTYYRLGLVELVDNEEKIQTDTLKKTILGSEYQSQIQIPPK